MKKLDIIYEDKEFLVVNKPIKQLTIATDKKEINTLYHEAREYIKKQNPKNKIFIVHRLDKETSGIVLFAKNEKLKYLLQENWQSYKREYLAIVEGIIKTGGIIKSYLKESKTYETYSTKDKTGKLAITKYEPIKNSSKYTLLKVKIETGRRNQIRVQLSDMGYPIIGDKKYKAAKNPINRLALHASYLEIIHPITKKILIFEAKTPKSFNDVVM